MKYFFNVLKSYPIKTIVIIMLFSIITFVKLIILDKLDAFVVLSVVIGNALMLLVFKVWLMVFFRDRILTAHAKSSPLTLLFMTVLMLIAATAFMAPLLNDYVPA